MLRLHAECLCGIMGLKWVVTMEIGEDDALDFFQCEKCDTKAFLRYRPSLDETHEDYIVKFETIFPVEVA